MFSPLQSMKHLLFILYSVLPLGQVPSIFIQYSGRQLIEVSGSFSPNFLNMAEWMIFSLNRMLFEWLRDR
jgi:hypothetical protein